MPVGRPADDTAVRKAVADGKGSAAGAVRKAAAPALSSAPWIGHWPPAYDVRPPEAPRPSTGQVVFEKEGPEPAPLPRPKATPDVAKKPSDGPGLAPKPVTASPATRGDAAKLKRRVQAVCGRQAKDVQVLAQPGNGVLVRVTMQSGAEKELTEKLLQTPEMTAPGVRLEVRIMP
jgi:hypothetical protein